ncbi:MAG: M23 family metallopeptidase [Leptospiraceae bacterium]|nr:M23 family metallopeptidase [Leptospiraceae bacterium]
MLKILFLILLFYNSIFSEIPFLESIDYDNPDLKKLREDIKHNLRVSKSFKKNETLVPIRFIKYKVKEGENFFKIMTRTGMDIDTLSSVNSLSSPQDIYTGMILLIPNMRGIYDSEEIPNNEKGRARLAKKYNMDESLFIFEDKIRNEWLVPGRTLGKIEKSFFYGLAFIPPLKTGFITSNYGTRTDPFTLKKTFHGGMDIAAYEGTPVYAAASGEVRFAKEKGGYGNLIVLRHNLGFETRYGHLSKILVDKGVKVQKGELIGKVGSTGRSTGNHLHFEVRRFSKNQKPEFYKHM